MKQNISICCRSSVSFNSMIVLRFQTHDDNASDNTNYDIELGESTDFQSVIWHFPDTGQCPLKECALLLSSRSVAAFHFRTMHAKITMACTVCGELVLAENAHDLLQHYQGMHPNAAQSGQSDFQLAKFRILSSKVFTHSISIFIQQTPMAMQLVDEPPQSNVYCWGCARGNTNIRCLKCERHFHRECVENRDDSVEICIECSKEDDFKWVCNQRLFTTTDAIISFSNFRPFNVSFIPKILKLINANEKASSVHLTIQFRCFLY